MQGVEPASGLVHGLRDKLCREFLLEQILILKWIVKLCIGHGAGVKPAVDNLRYAVHVLSALRAGDYHIVHIGAVKLDLLILRLSGQLRQLFSASHAQLMSAVRALPDIERGTPVAVAADAPVLDILQPVAEPAFAQGLRNPVDHLVVAYQIILHRGHADKPGFSCIVDKRRIAAPAVGIIMLKLRSGKEKPSLVQFLQDLRIGADCALLHLLLGGLAAHAGKGSSFLHLSVVIHQLHEGCIILAAHAGVVFTEGRCDMNDAGTVGHGDIVVAVDEKCLLVLLLHHVGSALVQGLILLVFQVFALHGLQHLVGLLSLFLCKGSENGVKKGLAHVIDAAVGGLYLRIGIFRIHAECDVGRQRPGCGGPCQEIGILILHLEADDGGSLLQRLVALSNLMGGKRCSAARAVGNNLEALIEQALIPDGPECPPLRLNEIIIVGDIGVIHIRPESDGAGELFPHALIFPYTLLALLHEGLDAVSLDLILAFDADLLLDFQLYRKTVGVPAGLSRHLVSLHGAVAGNHILDDSGQHMADMGLSVGRRRSVIKHVDRIILAVFDTLLENAVLFPELYDLLFFFHVISVRRDFVVHIFLLAISGSK